jgi:hypothetical protein
MPRYTFIRSVPLAITVEADTESEAATLSGHRLDDFFTDVTDGFYHSHDPEHPGKYTVAYSGEAIWSGDLR